MARLVLLALIPLAALAEPPREHRARERIAEWDGVDPDPGPTVRELDAEQRMVLHRPSALPVARIPHLGVTPEAVIEERIAAGPLGTRDSLRRTHLGGQAAWELATPVGISWYLPRRTGTLELFVATDATDDALRAKVHRLAKRLIAGVVPLSAGWDPDYEAWRAELARGAATPTPQDLLDGDLTRAEIARSGGLTATPGRGTQAPFEQLAQRSAVAVVDAVVHAHPEVRAVALAALVPHLTPQLAPALLDRMLRDGDLAVRWTAAIEMARGDGADALVDAHVRGDERELRGATQLYVLLPPERRTALLLRLASAIDTLPPAGQAWLVSALTALPDPVADERLGAWSAMGNARLARLALHAWLARGGEAALARAIEILGTTSEPREADHAIAALGRAGKAPHAKPLDRLLGLFEKGQMPPATAFLRAPLVSLEAYLKGVGQRTSPEDECADLRPRLARGQGFEWMRERYQRLATGLALPSARGTLLASARLPKGPRPIVDVASCLARLEDPRAPGVTILHGSLEVLHALAPEAFDLRDAPGRVLERVGLDLDAPFAWTAWLPAPCRPFDPVAPLAAPFPMAIELGSGDPQRLARALARSTLAKLLAWDRWTQSDSEHPQDFALGSADGGLAARVGVMAGAEANRAPYCTVVLGSTPAIVQDYIATNGARTRPVDAPETIAALELPLHAYLAVLDPPMLLGKSAELAIASKLAADASLALDGRRLVARATLSGIPTPFAGLLTGAPRARLEAPATILPGNACAAVAVSLDPNALVALLRNWPLKWYQKPAGLLAGSQKDAIDRWVTRIGRECGIALVIVSGTVEPVFYVALSGGDDGLGDVFARVEGQDQDGAPLWTRGDLYARSTKGFLCIARNAATLAHLAVGPRLAEAPMWRERAPTGGCVVGMADLGALARAGSVPGPLAGLGEVSILVERTGGALSLEVRHANELPLAK